MAHPDTAHALSGLVPVLVANGKAELAHRLLRKQITTSGPGGAGRLELLAVPAVMVLVAHFMAEDAVTEAEILIAEACRALLLICL